MLVILFLDIFPIAESKLKIMEERMIIEFNFFQKEKLLSPNEDENKRLFNA